MQYTTIALLVSAFSLSAVNAAPSQTYPPPPPGGHLTRPVVFPNHNPEVAYTRVLSPDEVKAEGIKLPEAADTKPTVNSRTLQRRDGTGGSYWCQYSKLRCYTMWCERVYFSAGTVNTWWGGDADAQWACDNWMPLCKTYECTPKKN